MAQPTNWVLPRSSRMTPAPQRIGLRVPHRNVGGGTWQGWPRASAEDQRSWAAPSQSVAPDRTAELTRPARDDTDRAGVPMSTYPAR